MFPNLKSIGGDDIDVSLNNPYYVLDNGIMYSSDYKTIYTIAGVWHYDRSANIDYEIEEILPFALASEKSFLEEVHFNKSVKKLINMPLVGIISVLNLTILLMLMKNYSIMLHAFFVLI